ncbi:hypothetical protein TNCV_3653681 [Trichonephila clavipes]|nr:hypothetical protein TNCV_3653681 [Trichonephila clavipes]
MRNVLRLCNYTFNKLYCKDSAFRQKTFSRLTPTPDSAIQLADIEPRFITPENLFPLIYGQVFKGLVSPQPRSAVGICIQRHKGWSMTMETKKMCFLVNDIYSNNSPGCLLELLKYVEHRLGVGFQISLDSTR